MNPYVNEDVMFQRLKDVQREAENRRLVGPTPSAVRLGWWLGATFWWLATSMWSTARSAIRSTLLRRRPAIGGEDHQTAEDAA